MKTERDSESGGGVGSSVGLAAELKRLTDYLHDRLMHPDYEYATTDGPRKAFDEHPPEGDGWERNTAHGRDGWERFSYHEEAYWRRLKAANVEVCESAGREKASASGKTQCAPSDSQH